MGRRTTGKDVSFYRDARFFHGSPWKAITVQLTLFRSRGLLDGSVFLGYVN